MTAAVEVRERPILFSGAMVRALRDGSKTQTRRVLGIQPVEILTPASKTARALNIVTRKWDGQRVWFALTVRGNSIEENRGTAFRCKYGEVGDRLWVRETFFDHGNGGDPSMPLDERVEYRAEPWDRLCEDHEAGAWTPSIFMPRWASRFTLEITEVRVERVQSISHEDVLAEGIDRCNSSSVIMARERYERLWNELNAKRGYGWDVNPWVWALTFAVVRA